MKAGLIAASAVALLQLAVAQPHGKQLKSPLRDEEISLIEDGLGHRHIHERAVGHLTTTII